MLESGIIFAGDKVIRDSYFNWLCDIGGARLPSTDTTYIKLFEQLHSVIFTSKIPMDKNRIEDARKLRDIFKDYTCYALYDAIETEEVSFLEVFLGIAMRMEFLMAESEDVNETYKWLWIIFNNLNLNEYSDEIYYGDPLTRPVNDVEDEVYQIIFRVINREYDENGIGGPFPLAGPKQDQRDVELWYQMNAYLNENFW